MYATILVLVLGAQLDAFPPAELIGHDSYQIRKNFGKKAYLYWPMNEEHILKLMHDNEPEVRVWATRTRERSIERWLDTLGDPPWADWLVYDSQTGGWTVNFIELREKISNELPRLVEDRFPNDWHCYRIMMRNWAKEYLTRGGYTWVVKLEWTLARMVEQDWKEKHKQKYEDRNERERDPEIPE